MKIANLLELTSAAHAAAYMLLEFIARIVGNFVVDIEQQTLLHPFALHGSGLPTACPPTNRAIFAWPGTACSWRFLLWCAESRPRFAISVRDNASTRTPYARAAKGGRAHA